MSERRAMALGGAWYPARADACTRELEGFTAGSVTPRRGARLCVVPHAGWRYSGRVAARAVAALGPETPVRLIVVLGGHLGRRDPLVTMSRGAWQTPYGWLPIHQDFAEALGALDDVVDETEQGFLQDNSIEVQLPIAHRRFPQAELLPIRVPPNAHAAALGEALARYLDTSGLSAVVLASTDLTHYGPAYGFTPAGPLPGARDWMARNDQGFIDAVQRLDTAAVLDVANRHHAACSAGGVVAVCRLARDWGAGFELLDHTTSAAVAPAENAVGYLGGVFVASSPPRRGGKTPAALPPGFAGT